MPLHMAPCSHQDGNCGTVAAVPFFISYQLLGSFIFLNLIVAVILENYTSLHEQIRFDKMPSVSRRAPPAILG